MVDKITCKDCKYWDVLGWRGKIMGICINEDSDSGLVGCNVEPCNEFKKRKGNIMLAKNEVKVTVNTRAMEILKTIVETNKEIVRCLATPTYTIHQDVADIKESIHERD